VHLSSDGFRATKSKRLAEEQDPVELPAFTGFNDHIAVADRSRSRIDPVKLEPEKLPAERAELVSADAIRRSRSRTKGEDEANRRRFNEAVENAKRAPAWPLIGNQIPPEDVDKSRLF